MDRVDDSKYLLFIEPKSSEKLKEPIQDDLVSIMEMALSKAKKGISRYQYLDDMGEGWEYRNKKLPSFGISKGGWMGRHTTECGESSDNYDYLLENGMITNSLSPFYLKWYRYSIPESEMLKMNQLADFYKKNPTIK